jgi:hypothetical protein
MHHMTHSMLAAVVKCRQLAPTRLHHNQHTRHDLIDCVLQFKKQCRPYYPTGFNAYELTMLVSSKSPNHKSDQQ